MKKQELKEQLRLANLKEGVLIDMLRGLSEELNDTTEALRRRRILYDRLANHSTVQKPKSMNEMAEMLYCLSLKPDTVALSFKYLPQNEQDEWMDRLLTILN